MYDLTRQRLRDALAGQLSSRADIEGTITAYAYWVCSAVHERGADWETSLREYAGYAARDAKREAEAERAELALLRRALRAVPRGGPMLDVGAGWGRFGPLYDELNLRAVYVEPSGLGVQLMRRSQLGQIARSVGEALPFPPAIFPAALIGWVLHHHSSNLDANRLLRETARVLAAGGLLFSIEPIRASFDMNQWREMLSQREVDIQVCEMQEFFQMPNAQGEIERHTLLIGGKT